MSPKNVKVNISAGYFSMKVLIKKYHDNLIINRFVKLFSVDVLIKASTFILLPVYLKLMSQTEFGLYNYLISIVGFFSQMLNFGLYVAQSKIYQELDNEQKGPFVFTIQLTLLLLIVPSVTIIYIFHLDNAVIHLLFKNPINYNAYRLPLLLATIASVYSFMLYNYLFTSQKIKQVQRYNLIRLVLLNVVLIAALCFLKNKVISRIIVTYIIETVLVVVFCYYMVKEMKFRFDKKHMLRSMKIGLPVMSAAICAAVVNFGDKFFLEKKTGFADLSVYYLAFSVAGFIPLLFNTFQNIWLPVFLKETNLNKNLSMTRKTVITLFCTFIALSVFVIVLMKVALAFSFVDNKYQNVMFILPVIMLSLTIDSISHLYFNYVTYFEQTIVLPVFSILIGIFSIACNLIFIKYYGLYGAAWSKLIISSFSFLMFYFLFLFNTGKKLKVVA